MMWPGIRLFGLCLLAPCCAVGAESSTPAVGAAPTLPPTEVRALHYGDVLFHFYQDDYFNGIVRAAAFRDQGHLERHRDDADLLLGGMYLSFGQHSQAASIFEGLLDRPSTPPAVRDRAWFYLGKVLHERGHWDQSERALRRVAGSLPADLDAERHLLLAQNLMYQGRFDAAIELLRGWSGPPEWAAYARFNLGVSLVRSDRMDQGLVLLEQVGAGEAQTEEQRGLRDKANVAAGFALLKENRPAEAANVLARVRLSGAYSNKALLGAGWAASAQENYAAALTPWLELNDRNVLDAAVQEARLAVPYAMAKLGAEAQAAEYYESAIGAFDSETRRLDESIVAIRSGKLLERAAERVGDGPQRGWYGHLTDLPDAPESRYLYLLMAGNEFQEGLRNYQTLAFMLRNLHSWQESIAAFRDMVDARRKAFSEHLPAALAALDTLDVAGIERRRDLLQSRFEDAVRDDDAVALASEENLEAWQRVQLVQQELDGRPDDAAFDDARDKLRLVRGVLLWRMSGDYKPRRYQARQALKSLSTAVYELRSRVTSVEAARRYSPKRNDEFMARIDAIEPLIARMLTEVGTAQVRQADFLADIAVAELQEQKDRLAEYRTQAQYALATTYDRASQAQPARGAQP
jgi:hypothetical protein